MSNALTNAFKLRAFLPLAGVAAALLFAGRANAGVLADWFGWTPTTVTTGYAPGYGYYYAPTTAYRTLYAPTAVVGYRPVSSCNACGTGVVASYAPVTTYVQRPILQAYTAYQPVYVAAPAPACGCARCGCSSCGCASCGFAPRACPTCGGGCASGACGAAVAPAVYPAAVGSRPTLSYMAPISSTPYAPIQAYANVAPSYPATAAYTTSAYGAPPTVSYAAPSYGTPTYVVPGQSSAGMSSPTYSMPILPNGPAVSGGIIQPSSPTLAPPRGSVNSADIAPALPGPIPSTALRPDTSKPHDQNSLSPQGTPAETPKTFEQPSSPNATPLRPIPDNRNSTAPGASGSQRPIDPNSRTASSMPMLRPGSNVSTPWPIAKTTAALMPVAADDADGWHAAR